MNTTKISLDEIVSLCKRRGFIYQGSDIYGGLSGTWDYGHLGVLLKQNIEKLWWDHFVYSRDDMYAIESAILMNQKVWDASGHTGAGFADPLVEDVKTGKRYRADHLLEDMGYQAEGLSLGDINKLIKENNIKSPDGNELSSARMFNMMFETFVGANSSASSEVYEQLSSISEIDQISIYQNESKSYLRPETAQGMFVNFKNIVDSYSPDLPFGIAQIGKCFRNEISPREFIFRVRELEIMELEYFINGDDWETEFDKWVNLSLQWFEKVGLDKNKIHLLEVAENDRAHYSKRTIDWEYEYPFGIKEIGAVAYRTDFDLNNHQKASNKNLKYTPKSGGQPFTPHVIEPTYGLGRHILAVLCEAYQVQEVEGQQRIYLKLPFHLAPVKFAVSPLLKNKPDLVSKAQEVYKMLKKEFGSVMWDDNGNIGKRYRKQDEIGTPYCVVVDFDTLEGEHKETVTVRFRDDMSQKRLKIDQLINLVKG